VPSHNRVLGALANVSGKSSDETGRSERRPDREHLVRSMPCLVTT
jgi:hypothetical protein